MAEQDFTVLGFEMSKRIQREHFRVGLSYDSDEQIRKQLFVLAEFLQERELTNQKLVTSPQDVGDSFEICWSHLNDRGRAFTRGALKKWTAARKENASDVLNKLYAKFVALE